MAITLFFVCILLMAVMFMQFKTVDETDITAIESMRETELREAIATWKTKHEELEMRMTEVHTKIEEYTESIETDKEASGVIEKELEASNLVIGKIDVEGEGVVITLAEGEEDITSYTLLELVDELRYAGAEAISINDIRLTNMADITEIANGTFYINGQRTSSPFVVKAIGNQTYLTSSLTVKNSGFVDQYSDRLRISLEKQKRVKILKSNQEITVKYLKEAGNK